MPSRSTLVGWMGTVGALWTIAAAAVESPRELESRGREAYAAGEYEQAAEQFDQAARAADETSLDPAIAKFNQANALLRAGAYEEAAHRYVEALRTPDLQLQKKTYYNLGNAKIEQARSLQGQQQMDDALEAAHEALTMYEQTLTLDPGQNEPRVNYELALQFVEELERMRKEQQQQQQQQQQQSPGQEQPPDAQDRNQQQPSQQPSPSPGGLQQPQEEPGSDDPGESDPQSESGPQDDDQASGSAGQVPADPPPPSNDPSGDPVDQRPAEEMTEEEANLLLDAIREEERAARENIRIRYGGAQPVEKDW